LIHIFSALVQGTFDFDEEEEGGDNEDEDDDELAEEASDDEMPSSTKQKGKNSSKSAKVSFDPETKDLLELFKDRSVEDRVTIIQRIRTCNHISLGEANRAKLQRFFCMLFDYFENMCDSFTPSDITNQSSDAADPNSFAFLMKSLDSLCPHLYEMSDVQAGLAGKLTRARLSAAQRFVFDTLAFTSKSDSNTDSEHTASLVSCFPSATALFMLKLIGQLFSVSDARHPVVTPSMLFISQCLAQVPVRGGRCLTAALFLCNTLVSYIVDSKRFIPELIAALTSIVSHQFESAKQTESSELRGLWSKLAAKELVASKLNMQALFLDNDNEFFSSSQFACASLQTTLQLISQTANAYAQVASFPELFQPVVDVLNAALTKFGTKHADKSLLVQLQSVCSSLQQRISSCLSLRRPLTMRTFRAVPIRSMAPKFDEDYRPGKDTDPDRDRAEAKQMKKKLKQQKRGAMRELRKDAAFMALENRKQQQIDGSYSLVMVQIFSASFDSTIPFFVCSASDKEKKLKATRTWLQQQASDYNGGAQSKKLKTKK
jgi:nucleolar protein 14